MVAIVATGGLSQQVHGERAVSTNAEWGCGVSELIEKDPERIAGRKKDELEAHGSDARRAEGVIMLARHERGGSATLQSATQNLVTENDDDRIATGIYFLSNQAPPARRGQEGRTRQHIGGTTRRHQQLHGTYPVTLATSVKAYRTETGLQA